MDQSESLLNAIDCIAPNAAGLKVSDPPLVAIVTAVRNGHPYLVQTLACVQAQIYPNLVHVVLDNASTDDTPSVIAAQERGRVPILTRRNSSLLPQIENWNAAVAMTPPHARYVKLLAADDLMSRDCIERFVALAEANPGVELVTAVDVFDDQVKPHGLEPGRSVFDGRVIARRLLRSELAWLPSHQIFFRATRERLTRAFDPDVNPGSDGDFAVRLLLQGQMGLVDAPLFYTRFHRATVTASLVADGATLYPPIATLMRYGHEVMSAAEIKRQRAARMRAILRHVAWWRATGRIDIATKNLERLARFDFEPRILDYLVALLTWPPHKVRKMVRQIKNRLSLPRNRITEREFLAEPVVRSSTRPAP